jgi:beta-alanine--pyruvate transaminase
MLAGIEVEAGATPGQRGYELMKELFWSGLHIKFTGDVGCVSPPLVIERSQIDEMVDIIRKVVSRHRT